MFNRLKNRLRHTHARDFFQVLGGNVAAQGLGFVTFVLLARVLGVEAFGAFSVAWAVFVLLGQWNELGVSATFVKLATQAGNCTQRFGELFRRMLWLRLLLSAGLALLGTVVAPLILSRWSSIDLSANTIRMLSLFSILYALFLFGLAYYQSLLDFRRYALLNGALYLVRFLGVLLLFYMLGLSVSSQTALWIMTLSYLVILPWFFSSLSAPPSAEELRDTAARLFPTALWIFGADIALLLIFRIDVLMLQSLSGSRDAGLYSAALQIALVFGLATSALFTTVFPKTEEMIRRHGLRGHIVKILSLSRFVLPLLLVVEGAAFFGFPLLFGNDFAPGRTALAWLLLVYALEIFTKPLVPVFYLYDKAHTYTLLLFGQLSLNILGNLLLIPSFGPAGAALATLFSRVVTVSFGIYLLWHFDARKPGRIP